MAAASIHGSGVHAGDRRGGCGEDVAVGALLIVQGTLITAIAYGILILAQGHIGLPIPSNRWIGLAPVLGSLALSECIIIFVIPSLGKSTSTVASTPIPVLSRSSSSATRSSQTSPQDIPENVNRSASSASELDENPDIQSYVQQVSADPALHAFWQNPAGTPSDKAADFDPTGNPRSQ